LNNTNAYSIITFEYKFIGHPLFPRRWIPAKKHAGMTVIGA